MEQKVVTRLQNILRWRGCTTVRSDSVPSVSAKEITYISNSINKERKKKSYQNEFGLEQVNWKGIDPEVCALSGEWYFVEQDDQLVYL